MSRSRKGIVFAVGPNAMFGHTVRIGTPGIPIDHVFRASFTEDDDTVSSTGTVTTNARALVTEADDTVSATATTDALTLLSDDFSTGSTLTGNGWTIEDTGGAGSSPSDLITSGEADLTVANGGTGGSFWYDGFDGVLWYKEITGAADMRARVRVRNAADTGVPPTSNFRVAGIQIADPDRTTMEYVHIGLGATAIGASAIEWKTTDASDSAFEGIAATLTGGELLYDIRIVRRDTNNQLIDLYYRAGTATALEADTGWTLLTTVDRTDDTVPDRATFGGTTAVSLPSTLRWGMMVYASTGTHNIRMFVDEVQFRSTTD